MKEIWPLAARTRFITGGFGGTDLEFVEVCACEEADERVVTIDHGQVTEAWSPK